MTLVKSKAAKVTLAIEAGEFPWERVPIPGTVGGKNMPVVLKVDHGGGLLNIRLKGGSAQKALVIALANPQGGHVVITGTLVADRLESAGIAFQPKKADKPAEPPAEE